MKSWALLSSNLPSVIHRSNLSPSREAFHFYFYSNNDPTSPKGPRKQNRFSERRFSEKLEAQGPFTAHLITNSKQFSQKKDNQNERIQINACVVGNTLVSCCEPLV